MTRKLLWRLMKEAAHRRHAILVTAWYGHDPVAWNREMLRHERFVEAIYLMMKPA